MSRDWEQDILEWVGNKQVKKLQSGNLIKFIISIFTAIGVLVVVGIRWNREFLH